MKGSEWGVADGLFNTFFALVDAYSSRGSPREALFFAEQAHHLADSLNAPVYASRALARMGEILIYQGRYQKGFDNVSEAGKLLADMQCADVVDIDRLHAEWYTRTSPGQNAKELYERAKSALEGLDRAYGAYDSGSVSMYNKLQHTDFVCRPRRSSLSMVAKERIAPVLFARLLSQYSTKALHDHWMILTHSIVWILRDDDAVEKEALLDTFLSLPPSPLVKAEQAALVAKLTMHNVYGRFGMDMFLSSITESSPSLPFIRCSFHSIIYAAIAIPMGMSRPEGVTPSLTHDIPGLLEKAAQMYWSELDLISTQGEVPKVRNAAVSLAMIQALQTSLGKSGTAAANILVNLLGQCLKNCKYFSPLIQRQMLPLPYPFIESCLMWFGTSSISCGPPMICSGRPRNPQRARRWQCLDSVSTMRTATPRTKPRKTKQPRNIGKLCGDTIRTKP